MPSPAWCGRLAGEYSLVFRGVEFVILAVPSHLPRKMTLAVSIVAGGCPFHVYLEPLENQDPRRSRLTPLSLHMPPDAWLPLMDIDFTAPFRCLSVQSVLTVFALMLQVGQRFHMLQLRPYPPPPPPTRHRFTRCVRCGLRPLHVYVVLIRCFRGWML